ncbi:MAG TPA: methyltransferase domain-containing protein, partial [Pirellulales bacterium]
MTEAALEHHKTNRAFYDRISEAYDFIADSSEKPARQAGLKALAIQPGEKVLEIGYGTGNEIIDLARLVGPSGTVAGIDVSPGMCQVAQRKIDAAELPKAPELAVGDARKLPYPDASFDAAYTSFTLELFPEEDIAAVLAE